MKNLTTRRNPHYIQAKPFRKLLVSLSSFWMPHIPLSGKGIYEYKSETLLHSEVSFLSVIPGRELIFVMVH